MKRQREVRSITSVGFPIQGRILKSLKKIFFGNTSSLLIWSSLLSHFLPAVFVFVSNCYWRPILIHLSLNSNHSELPSCLISLAFTFLVGSSPFLDPICLVWVLIPANLISPVFQLLETQRDEHTQ